MGLVNAVVPHDKLMEEARAWAGEIVQLSPTAIKLAKQSFNMSSEKFRGVEAFASSALALYYDTDEAMEGRNAFIEKRRPDFGKRSEEHTSELQSLMRISYAVFCLKKKKEITRSIVQAHT